ncbi:MAG: DUF2249 domain-containing protein [Proteobacteria bacterium]|nr:DUF2249 domain-containing protein [Pseudomonadota bacterium]
MAEILDVRALEPKDRHKGIFDAYITLGPGEAFILVNDHEPKPLLYQFQAEHYGEFEWWPLESGPDVWRVQVGKALVSGAATTLAGYMQTDHLRLDSIMARFKGAIKGEQWEAAIKSFKEFDLGLRRHIQVEEELLFPAFEAKTGMKDAGPTMVMKMEHEEIREILGRTLSATEAKDASAVTEASDTLVNYLSDHNMKEEHVLYPELDACVDDIERAEAIKKAQIF